MEKSKVLKRITDKGIVAVVRAESEDQALKIANACIEGGIDAIEITFTVPHAEKVIERLCSEYDTNTLLVGAGTVLDAATARIAMMAGASFIVSPGFDEGTVKICNRYKVPVMAGIMTVTEAMKAMEAGADVLKIFPAELFGPTIIKAFKAPLPHGVFMPTGGVDTENAADWIKAGAVAVGVGGSLTAGSKTGDYADITKKAKIFVERIAEAKAALKK